MKKTHQDTPPSIVQNKHNGPTIEDLERLLKRIEELDLKLGNKTLKTADSKRAA